MIFFLLLLPREKSLKLEGRKHNPFTTAWCFHISSRPSQGRWGYFFQERSHSLLKGHFQPLFLCTGGNCQEEQYIWIMGLSQGRGGNWLQSREGQTRWRQRLSPSYDVEHELHRFVGIGVGKAFSLWQEISNVYQAWIVKSLCRIHGAKCLDLADTTARETWSRLNNWLGKVILLSREQEKKNFY